MSYLPHSIAPLLVPSNLFNHSFSNSHTFQIKIISTHRNSNMIVISQNIIDTSLESYESQLSNRVVQNKDLLTSQSSEFWWSLQIDFLDDLRLRLRLALTGVNTWSPNCWIVLVVTNQSIQKFISFYWQICSSQQEIGWVIASTSWET